MCEKKRFKEQIPAQEYPITPLGIILACNRLIQLKPQLERTHPIAVPDLSELRDSERGLFENFPLSQLHTEITEDGMTLHYAETTVTVNGIMVARQRTYIGAPTLPEDQPYNTFELFGQTNDPVGEKPLPVQVTLRRYPKSVRKPNGNFVSDERISITDGRLEKPEYNPYLDDHGLTPKAAKDLADKMGIPSQTSMW